MLTLSSVVISANFTSVLFLTSPDIRLLTNTLLAVFVSTIFSMW